jgi:hypothetical protein
MLGYFILFYRKPLEKLIELSVERSGSIPAPLFGGSSAQDFMAVTTWFGVKRGVLPKRREVHSSNMFEELKLSFRGWAGSWNRRLAFAWSSAI